jgi:DNA repair exonuclease SbcCD ATPase subunit
MEKPLNSDLHRWSCLLEQKQGQKNQIKSTLQTLTERVEELTAQRENIDTAKQIIQTVSQITQKELEYHVSELATLALTAIFPDPYTLTLSFDIKRNRSEARLLLTRGGQMLDPMYETGGGVVDVCAFALRVSLWSLMRNKTRGVIIMDEPFKNLSKGLQERASLLLQTVSKKLNLQFIIVTHEAELIKCADRVFEVSQKDGISTVVKGK